MLYHISLLIILGFSVLFNIAMVQAAIISANNYNHLIEDYKKLKHDYKAAKHHIRGLEQLLRDQYIKNQLNNTFIRQSDTTINNDIIQDALKIAMIQSHPDNGGCAEEFIRFKDALDKLKR